MQKKNNYNFKFHVNPLFINEHLSPKNRHLFELAREKKNVLNYKFLWTKNGYVYLRRNEQSLVYKILDEPILNSLSTTTE